MTGQTTQDPDNIVWSAACGPSSVCQTVARPMTAHELRLRDLAEASAVADHQHELHVQQLGEIRDYWLPIALLAALGVAGALAALAMIARLWRWALNPYEGYESEPDAPDGELHPDHKPGHLGHG